MLAQGLHSCQMELESGGESQQTFVMLLTAVWVQSFSPVGSSWSQVQASSLRRERALKASLAHRSSGPHHSSRKTLNGFKAEYLVLI